MKKNKDPFIPIILGTARKGRQSIKAARYVFKLAKKHGLNTKLVDVRDFIHPATIPSWAKSKKTETWKKLAKKADGFIIVCPEYNHSYPGELKILLDSAYAEYEKKPAVVCGVSSGGFGGARMVEHLYAVLITLKLAPINAPLYFSNIEQLFDKRGNITDKSYEERSKKMFEEILWYAKALKKARGRK